MHVDFGGSPESEHGLHLTANGHYEHAGISPFRHPGTGVPAIDPGLEQTTPARNGHAPMSSLAHTSSPGHLLQPDHASLTPAHLTHGFYGDMARSSQTPETPSNASPQFPALSPATRPKHVAPACVPDDRSPPPRDVTDDTLDDAYAAFILYCNPSFALSTDTSELVKLFRMPPKSEGNSFNTWDLFELIRKFDAKEIKTWTQLALDLGVAPPDTDKGQSTQKVQQYSVRLKRWMRAMHIDAFFEYLLGKQHPYYMQIPPQHDPFPEEGRDGVPLEEDLAIRALDPKFKPKRGRRKADDGEDDLDMDDGTPARKRPSLDTSIPFGNALQPQSAYPSSAHPDHMSGFLTPQDPWTAAANRLKQSSLTPYSASPMSAGQQIRWRLNPHDTPATPHPLSAVTPSSAHNFFDEPQSAITPSSASSSAKPRARRRHGPAVSSAWSSNNASSSGKLRGRPPNNRSVKDGPFVTFPVNPKGREGTPINVHRHSGNLTPIAERAQTSSPGPEPVFRFPPTPASAVSPGTVDASIPGPSQKPHRLSLQVPQNIGNPVRLVTPTVLVNGEEDPSPSTGIASSAISFGSGRSSAHPFEHGSQQHYQGTFTPSDTPAQAQPPRSQPQTQSQSPTALLPSIPLDTLNRALAAELIRAPLSGRGRRLRGTEAKNLASSILLPLYAKPSGSSSPTKVLSDQMLGIAISSCLGLTSAVGLGAGGPNGGVRRVDCIRFRVGGDGYESPIDEDDEDAENLDGEGSIKETFDVLFAVSFGGLAGEWTAKSLVATPKDLNDAGAGLQELERMDPGQHATAAWKSKFLDAQRRLWESQEEVRSLKEKVLEAVL